MKTGTKILLVGGALVVAGAFAYRAGVKDLVFKPDSIAPAPGDASKILVRIMVTNPSKIFGYPVPRMLVNAFDASGTWIGTVTNYQLQYIPANGVSYVWGVVSPNIGSLAGLLISTITSGHLPDHLTFHGVIQAGPIEIPIDTSASITGGYRPAYRHDDNTDYAHTLVNKGSVAATRFHGIAGSNGETLSRLRKGDYFKFPEGKTVYIYDGRNRDNGYGFYKFDDTSDYRFTKANRAVLSKSLSF